MGSLIHVFYVLSTVLLVPVMLALLLLLAFTLASLGGFAREAVDRRRYRRALRSLMAELRLLPPEERAERAEKLWLNEGSPDILSRLPLPLGCRRDAAALQKWLEDIEIATARVISRTSFGTRVGPMLGLMATLIPLGPALMALAGGDIQSLSRNLIVAFAATVVGLFVAGLSYAVSLGRKNWYAQELSDLAFLAGCGEGNPNPQLKTDSTPQPTANSQTTPHAGSPDSVGCFPR